MLHDTLIIKVGNTAPVVTIEGKANKSFYWKNKPFSYQVVVKDVEDKKIDPAKVKVFYTYNPLPTDNAAGSLIKASAAGEINYPGKALMAASDCKSCHQLNTKAVGPAFFDVAKRYKIQNGAIDKLAKKIINGGGGSWGAENVMSAHPQLSMPDAKDIVKCIFSLTDKKTTNSNVVAVPLRGKLNLKYNDAEPRGEYTIVATYTDNGGKVVGPLKGTNVITLRHADMNTAFADAYVGFPRFRDKLSQGGNKAYLLMKNIDLTGTKNFGYTYGSKDADGEMEVRIDSQAGPVISKVTYVQTGSFDKVNNITGQISVPVTGRHDVYFYAVKHTKPNDAIIKLMNIAFIE